MKSFWVIMHRTLTDPHGDRDTYVWVNGVMEDSHRKAVERLWDRFSPLVLVNETPDAATYTQSEDRFGEEVAYTVLEQEEPPPIDCYPVVTFNDSRAKDLEWERKKLSAYENEPVREGFKKMPLRIH